jgi:alanine-synthesizing transaminase
VELPFFEKVIDIAREHGIWVVQDLAYADLCFDGYVAPSILQVEGARDIAVEFFSMSKSYNMPGWRVGFCCGNRTLVGALARMKSYLDYGMFTPIQVAAIAALEGDQSCVGEINAHVPRRRDVLCEGLNAAGWPVHAAEGDDVCLGADSRALSDMGSLEFSKKLLRDAKVAVSPGVGFGEYGEGHVRFGLIENEHRTRQAIRNIKRMFRDDGLLAA